jgi:hydrogenase maturation protease
MMSTGAMEKSAQMESNEGDAVISGPAAAEYDSRPRGSGETLIIGLGNPLISDDSVGLRVAQRLRDVLADRDDIVVTEDYWGGLRLMERMIGFKRAIVIDAICTGSRPGTIHHLTTEMISTQKSASAHDVNLPTALAFGRHAGALLPRDQDVYLLGIEAEDVINFSDECTPAVAAAIPDAVQEVIQLLESMLGEQAK